MRMPGDGGDKICLRAGHPHAAAGLCRSAPHRRLGCGNPWPLGRGRDGCACRSSPAPARPACLPAPCGPHPPRLPAHLGAIARCHPCHPAPAPAGALCTAAPPHAGPACRLPCRGLACEGPHASILPLPDPAKDPASTASSCGAFGITALKTARSCQNDTDSTKNSACGTRRDERDFIYDPLRARPHCTLFHGGGVQGAPR